MVLVSRHLYNLLIVPAPARFRARSLGYRAPFPGPEPPKRIYNAPLALSVDFWKPCTIMREVFRMPPNNRILFATKRAGETVQNFWKLTSD
mmetsp:Transcript_30702/g.94854  ORF Transcript_30702/g.94854 Transcript_30702/m.94854 type:complete len:91 (-) Transcript_30702:104-376(-)